MHRALQISEVVHEIIGHLLDQGIVSYKTRHHTILNVALTCRLFCGPCLDILWAKMNSLIPLFKILSGFSYVADSPSPAKINGPISEKDLQRFNSYANRIKVYHGRDVNRVHRSAYDQILEATKRKYLLPRLVLVRVTMWEETIPADLLCFLSPRIRDVLLFCPIGSEGRDCLSSAIPLLSQGACNLRTLNLSCTILEPALEAILQIPRIQSLRLSHRSQVNPLTIDVNFLKSIVSSLTLTSLSIGRNIDIQGESATSVSTSLPDDYCYPALRTLELDLKHRNIFRIPFIFRGIKLPVLNSLSFQFDATGSDGSNLLPSKWLHCCRAIQNVPTIRCIHFSYAAEGQAMGLSFSALADVLPKTIQEISISGPIFSAEPSSYMEKFIHDHKDLKMLFLFDLAVSWSTFLNIAKHLPLLKELGLQLALDQLPPLDEIPILSHQLDYLDLSGIAPRDARAAARCIDRLYPYLANLSTPDDDHDDDVPDARIQRQLWEVVKYLRADLQAARQDQIERGAEPT